MWCFLSLLLTYLSLAGAHARNDKASGHISWLPSLRLLFKHSDQALADYLAEIPAKGFNHDHVGATALTPPLHYPASLEAVPKGFRVNTRRQLLGKGRNVYERAVQVGLRERGVVNRIPWAELIFADQDWKRWKKGTCILTFVKCYGLLWSANPCKLIYARWDENLPREMGRGKYSSLGFSTVSGHLIAGEERFSIEFSEKDCNVWLDLYSVSRGAGLLGKVAMPLIRPLQKIFFAEQCRQMLRLVEEDTERDVHSTPRRT